MKMKAKMGAAKKAAAPKMKAAKKDIMGAVKDGMFGGYAANAAQMVA